MPGEDDQYKKADMKAVDGLHVALFLEAHSSPPKEIWLDFDNTDDPLAQQLGGRFSTG